MFDFEKLEVYKKSLDFADEIYNITKTFPKSEIFGITSQFRRAALSISLNIAEGSGRTYNKERKQFYQISRTSVHECIPIIEICKRQNFINDVIHKRLYQNCTELGKMLIGLIKSVSDNNV